MIEPTYLSIIFTCLCVGLVSKHITGILSTAKLVPGAQAQAIRSAIICALLPIWAIFSSLTVTWPEYHHFLNIAIDTYEVFVIFQFFSLLQAYVGGPESIKKKIKSQPPFKVFLGLLEIHPDESFYLIIRILIYQFIVLKPLISIAKAYFHYLDMSEDLIASTLFNMTILRFSSLFIAMMALLMFYHCYSKTFWAQGVLSKFAFIKIIISLHVFQSIFFVRLVKNGSISDSLTESAEIRSIKLQYLLLSFEMFILAILLPRFYPAKMEKFENTEADIELPIV